MRVGPTPFWSSLYLEVCPTITKRRPNILLAREKNSSSCQMCKKNLPPRGCVLFVIDKIGNFVTIPVHAFGSESEHSTICVTMFGGRISIGVQSKQIFFFSPPGGTNHRSHFPRTLPQQRKDGLLARKEDDGPRRQSPPLQYQRTSDITRAALSRSRYSRRLVS